MGFGYAEPDVLGDRGQDNAKHLGPHEGWQAVERGAMDAVDVAEAEPLGDLGLEGGIRRLYHGI
jgi:hypothetical protein